MNTTPHAASSGRPRTSQVPPQDRSPRRQYEVPDNELTREHAKEALRLERELRALGVKVERIRPSLDFQGHVRMTFDGVDQLLNMIVEREDRARALQAEVNELRGKLDLPLDTDPVTS